MNTTYLAYICQKYHVTRVQFFFINTLNRFALYHMLEKVDTRSSFAITSIYTNYKDFSLIGLQQEMYNT